MLICYFEHPISLQILQPYELGCEGENYWVLKVGSKHGELFADGGREYHGSKIIFIFLKKNLEGEN